MLLTQVGEATGKGSRLPQAYSWWRPVFPALCGQARVDRLLRVLIGTTFCAEAMGLGAVPIGAGDSDVFAAAAGLAYDRNGSIAEIAISTRSDVERAE
jgi:hypothetical protein